MTTTSANTGLLPERVETAARERIAASLATFRRKILFFRRWVNSAAQSKARRG
jgi:hypothetical protein